MQTEINGQEYINNILMLKERKKLTVLTIF